MLTEVDGYTFPQLFSDNKGYAIQHNLKGLTLAKYWLKIYYNFYKADLRLKQTIKKGKCYYGPFKGEFGHMTAHTAPFLMYLHSKGVKIIYCGMELHKPLLIRSLNPPVIFCGAQIAPVPCNIFPTCHGCCFYISWMSASR